MGPPRQEYWSGEPFLPPEDLPNVGTEPTSLPSPPLASGFFTTNATWELYEATAMCLSFLKVMDDP